ncbi:hypothetical protein HK104_004824 [Borealophlyctis nickersoniae]|nr:hypothetical protein HK104_004824 [Borealophlyctis nickersoniae]
MEAAIIVSVLLSFCRQMFGDDPVMFKRLRKQVWAGTGIGLLISLAIAAGVIVTWYKVAANRWEKAELVWEGTLAIISSIIITIMAVAMLKSSSRDQQEKWRNKLIKSMRPHKKAAEASETEAGESSRETVVDESTPTKATLKARLQSLTSERYALFFLPFITILREGIEAIVFMGGVAVSEPGSSIPLAAVVGILVGIAIGFAMYHGGSHIAFRSFFVISTIVLFIVAAGLWVRGITALEQDAWLKSLWITAGGDEGAAILYNVNHGVWAIDCCLPKEKGWTIFNAIAGWNNYATIATVLGYIAYWVALSATLVVIKLRLKRQATIERNTDVINVGVPPANAAGGK